MGSKQPRDRSSDSQGPSRIQQSPPIEEARQDLPPESSEHSPADTLRWPDSRLYFWNRATLRSCCSGPPNCWCSVTAAPGSPYRGGKPSPKAAPARAASYKKPCSANISPCWVPVSQGTISKSVPAVAPWHTKGPYDVDGGFRTSPSSQGMDHVPLQRSLWIGGEQHLRRASGGF